MRDLILVESLARPEQATGLRCYLIGLCRRVCQGFPANTRRWLREAEKQADGEPGPCLQEGDWPVHGSMMDWRGRFLGTVSRGLAERESEQRLHLCLTAASISLEIIMPWAARITEAWLKKSLAAPPLAALDAWQKKRISHWGSLGYSAAAVLEHRLQRRVFRDLLRGVPPRLACEPLRDYRDQSAEEILRCAHRLWRNRQERRQQAVLALEAVFTREFGSAERSAESGSPPG